MKKIFALIIAVAMVLTLSVCIFAEDYNTNPSGESESNNVTVNVDIDNGETVYDVSVKWEPLDFTYSVTKTWDSENHEYDVVTTVWPENAYNENKGPKITVANHTNKALGVTATLTTDDGEGTTITEINTLTVYLKDAAGNNITAAKNLPSADLYLNNYDAPELVWTVYCSVDGTIPETTADATVVAQVTITLN